MRKPGFLFSVFMRGALIIIISASMLQAAPFVHQSSNRVTINFDRAWRFIGSDNTTYSLVAINDSSSSWTKVCLPQQNITLKHAYFTGGTVGTGAGAAYMFTSWYRKHYTPPTTYNGRRFILEFEGVATIATVYVNGTLVGSHSGAYTGFSFDVTSQIVTGSDNVIAVQVNSTRQTGIPPEGGNVDYCVFGGIIRNVRLIIADPLHVELNWVSIPNATSSTSTPTGTVTSHVRLVNNSATSKSYTLTTSVVDNTNNVVASGSATGSLAAGATSVITYATTTGSVTNFWSPNNPYLHTVYTQVMDGAAYVDEFTDTTGFRTVFPLTPGTAYSGFYINGVRYKLFGANRHETFPFFGRAAARRVQRKDADILKYDLGCTLVRSSHYPQAPDYIKRCDEIGLLLLEEVPGWMYIGGGSPTTAGTWQGYLMQDLKEMIYRDRNHPSVISFGVRVNESPDNTALYTAMNDTAHAIDPTRPTHGARKSDGVEYLEDMWTRNFTEGASGGPFPWLTTESVGHTLTPQVHSWDNDVAQMAQVTAHVDQENTTFGNTYSMGRLAWCAFDYNSPHANATTAETGGRSATAPYLSPHGIASIFRIPKLAGYFFQSQRNPATCGYMVSIANDRTGSSPTTVTVFSNCPTVELFRDGVSLGSKSGTWGTSLPHPVFQWTGVTAGGTLRAVGSAGGVTNQVSPPGTPTAIVLNPDDLQLYDGGDMTRVVVSLVDASGRAIRSSADSITMSASGAGDFIGEARSALEGGQLAFWVKTRDGVTGTITATATDITTTVTPGTATITVISEPTTAADYRPQIKLTSVVASQCMLKMVMGRVNVPAGFAKGSVLFIYDLTGKLLYRAEIQKTGTLDLSSVTGASSAVRIVKIEDAKAVKH